MFLKPDPHPIVIDIPNVEKAFTIQNVTDFLIFMEMFVEEGLDLFFIQLSHS